MESLADYMYDERHSLPAVEILLLARELDEKGLAWLVQRSEEVSDWVLVDISRQHGSSRGDFYEN